MPVLFKGAESDMYPAVDVEALVIEVRERLCLKNREKCCSNRRSAPYHVKKHSSSSSSSVFEHCSKKHSSPEACVYPGHCKQRPPRCACGKKLSSKLRDSDSSSSSSMEDPRVLLEKLLAEQSLIQEAVRRLRSQRTASPTVSNCASRKFFPFVDDDDSCDQFSNQTPSYSESEDDSISQHSVDL